MAKTSSTFSGRASKDGVTSREARCRDKRRYDIRIYGNDAEVTSTAWRRAIRSIRKLLPTLAERRISVPVFSLFTCYGKKDVATIEHVPKFGEITREKADRIIEILARLGLKARAIDARWAVMK